MFNVLLQAWTDLRSLWQYSVGVSKPVSKADVQAELDAGSDENANNKKAGGAMIQIIEKTIQKDLVVL